MSVALQGEAGLTITERGEDGDVTFSRPLRCVYCLVLVHVSNGEATLEEDSHVRPIQYR